MAKMGIIAIKDLGRDDHSDKDDPRDAHGSGR